MAKKKEPEQEPVRPPVESTLEGIYANWASWRKYFYLPDWIPPQHRGSTHKWLQQGKIPGAYKIKQGRHYVWVVPVTPKTFSVIETKPKHTRWVMSGRRIQVKVATPAAIQEDWCRVASQYLQHVWTLVDKKRRKEMARDRVSLDDLVWQVAKKFVQQNRWRMPPAYRKGASHHVFYEMIKTALVLQEADRLSITATGKPVERKKTRRDLRWRRILRK